MGIERRGWILTSTITSLPPSTTSMPSITTSFGGHSLHNLTFPGVIAQRSARIAHALFIAALVTSRGERGIDSIPIERRPGYFEMAEQSPDNSLLPSFDAAWDRFFPSLDENRARAVYERLTPQPLGPYLQANSGEPSELIVPSTYVVLEEDRTFPVPVARVCSKIRSRSDHPTR